MPRPTIGSRIRKTRKQGGKSAPPLKASMKRTAKRGRQAPGTPRRPAARLSKAAQSSAADTKKRMGEMGDVRAKQTATRKKTAAPKTAAPKTAAPKKSTATTAQDFADVGYEGLAPPTISRSPEPIPQAPAEDITSSLLSPDVKAAIAAGVPAPGAAPAVSPNPFTGSIYEQQAQPDPYAAQASLGLNIPEIPQGYAPQAAAIPAPAPYQQGRDFGASWPVTTPSGPVIPGVSGPPEQAGPATTLDYDVWGADPPAPAPLYNPGDPGSAFDPDQPGQLERDYEYGNITPTTPGIDTPLPGAAPGQMTPDPGYLPPPPEMDQAELDKLSAQVRLRQLMANGGLRNLFRNRNPFANQR